MEPFNAEVTETNRSFNTKNQDDLEDLSSQQSKFHEESSNDSTPEKHGENALKQKRDPKLRLLWKIYQIVDELGLEKQKKPIKKLKLAEIPSQKANKSTFQLLCPIVGCTKVYVISVYPRRILYHSLQNHIAAVHVSGKQKVGRLVGRLEDDKLSSRKSSAKKAWELCRCCLKQEPDVLLIDEQIKLLFSELIPTHQLDDGSICLTCSDNLQSFSRFKQQIIEERERFSMQKTSAVKDEPEESQLFVFADNVDLTAEIKVEPTIFDWQLDEKMSGSESSDWRLKDEESFQVKQEKRKKTRKSEDVEKFSCDHCDLTFTKKTRLHQHKKNHKFSKDEFGRRVKYPCDQCDLTFLLESRLVLHKNKMHSNGILCPHCQSEFSSVELMRQHSRFAHRVTGGRTSYKKRNYEYELCTVCGKQVRHDLMKQHIELVHVAEKNIICTDCGKAFLLPIYLKTHRQVHHNNGVRPFICDFCGKGSFTKRLLIIHIKRHHTVKVEVRCNLCLKGFFTKQDLKRHLRRMHAAGEEDDGLRANLKTNLFHCPFCSRTYQGMKMCQMHMKATHPGQTLKVPKLDQ